MKLIRNASLLVIGIAAFPSSNLLQAQINPSGTAKEYPYFITDDGLVFLEATNADGTHVIRPEEIERAKKAKDSRPAAEDPEGNWGLVSDGVQASIRFEKTIFGTNEAINATVIVRNVGDNWHVFNSVHGLASDIIVTNPSGIRLERKDWAAADTRKGQAQRMTVDHHGKALFPGLQVRLGINLQKFYNFSEPGKYLVSMKVKASRERSSQFTDVQSGNAVITITNSAVIGANAPAPKSEK